MLRRLAAPVGRAKRRRTLARAAMDAAGQSTPGRIGLVSADAASSTGRWIVTNVANGPAEIRDARTLALRQTIAGRADSIALSPDDRTLLVGGHDGSVRFVDLPSGEARSFPGHESAVVAAAFSRDGRSAATGGRDNRIQTWDVRRGTVRETLTGHTAQVVGLAFSRDGRTLYSAGSDGKPLIWDLTGVRRLGRSVALRPDLRPDPIPIAGYAGTLANYDASPDGRTFAVGEEDGTVRLVDTRTLRPRMAIRALSGHLASVGYLSDRTLLVTDETGSAVFVDPVTGAVGRRHDGFGAPSKPSLSRDARLMATISTGGEVVLRTLSAGRPSGSPRYYGTFAMSVALSPDGRTIAVTGAAGVEIVDVATLRRRTRLPGTQRGLTTLPFTPDGRFVAVGSIDGWVRLWSTATWRPASRPLAARIGPVMSVAVSQDSQTLAAGGNDGTIQLFDVPSQQPIDTSLAAVSYRPVAPLFTHDGTYLFGISDAGRLYRWDVRRPRGHAKRAPSPAAGSRAPNGRMCCQAATMRRPAERSLGDAPRPGPWGHRGGRDRGARRRGQPRREGGARVAHGARPAGGR
jgi:WD40 repeat protein